MPSWRSRARRRLIGLERVEQGLRDDGLLRSTAHAWIAIQQLVPVVAKLRMVSTLDFYPASVWRQQRPIAHHVAQARHAIVGSEHLGNGNAQAGEILLLGMGRAHQYQRAAGKLGASCTSLAARAPPSE